MHHSICSAIRVDWFVRKSNKLLLHGAQSRLKLKGWLIFFCALFQWPLAQESDHAKRMQVVGRNTKNQSSSTVPPLQGPVVVTAWIKIKCCTSEAMAQALNCCAESPVGSLITQFDVRDYFNRPKRTQQISLKFNGIQLCRVQSDKSYAANEK